MITEINDKLRIQDVELAKAEDSDVLDNQDSLTELNQLKTENWQLRELSSQSDKLLTELLKYNLTPDDELKARITSLIADLEEKADDYDESLTAQISVMLVHSRTVLRQRDIEEEILTGLDATPTAALNDQLSQLVSGNFELRLAQQNDYRRYLMIYAGALLLLLMYAAYRLVRAFRDLQHANENLEQHVAERTVDLNRALQNLKESQAQLVQSEKMASLGQMVAGITHEINTPLAYVRSGLEITQMRIGELGELAGACGALNRTLADENASNEAIHQQLQQVGELSNMLEETETVSETQGLLDDGLHGMDQIADIISNLKNFSRMDRAKVAAFNVNDGLDDTLKIANNIVKHKSVIKQYGDLRPITCSPSSINQVFLNLITNAAQATGDDGEIRITTTQLDDAVQIAVRDNGKGIPPGTVDKIFDPFFTTKDVGEGTGLGLSIVQRIINEHNGTISVESEEGQGTCFTVILPANTTGEG